MSYADSLRQQARWIKESLEQGRMAADRPMESLADIDVDELESAADHIESLEAKDRVRHKHKHKWAISSDNLPGGMGWIFFLGILFCLSFDGEIRCSLGNKSECAKMEVQSK